MVLLPVAAALIIFTINLHRFAMPLSKFDFFYSYIVSVLNTFSFKNKMKSWTLTQNVTDSKNLHHLDSNLRPGFEKLDYYVLASHLYRRSARAPGSVRMWTLGFFKPLKFVRTPDLAIFSFWPFSVRIGTRLFA